MTIEHDTAWPVTLVTGVGRTVGIGAGIATALAESGWDIAFCCRRYTARLSDVYPDSQAGQARQALGMATVFTARV
jgi:NAD(P)-dependent dehydrogenase (short-subunit alcohol dehydrogenase family)